MRVLILAAAAAVALTACSGGNEANNTDMNAGMTDMNAGMTDMNATDMNATINAADGMNATENAAVNDLTSNDADTNLANGT